MNTITRYDYLPTPAQELLLKAALFNDDRAVAAWRVWKAQHDLVADRIDGGAFRLLPLLYLNLKSLGVDDEYTQRLKGIHRKAWYENQVRLHKLAQSLRMFAQAGIPTLILKGAPLALLHYKDVGARPMSDVDVLVPTARAADAIALLHEHGWQDTRNEQMKKVTPAVLTVRHSWGFSNAERGGIDLHWHALHMACFPGADDDFWQGARPVEVDGAHTTTLNPTDMLLHVCVHGSHWNHVSPIRWAADGWAVLQNTAAALEWDRMLHLAQKLRVTLHLHSTLGYLAGALGAPVPAEVVDALARVPVTKNDERVHHQFGSHTNNLLRKAGRHWHNYQRYTHLWRAHAQKKPPVNIVDFMKVSMGFGSVWDVVPRAVDRARRPHL